jgi:hypothetical protein
MTLSPGETITVHTLPDTDGTEHSFPVEGTPTVVVFTCNHCPYALGWHERLLQVARDYDGVRFFAVNPNDADRYPRDSFDAMKERVQAENAAWLREALDAVLAGEEPARAETEPVGCSVKWK